MKEDSEENATYINSRGFLKSSDYHSATPISCANRMVKYPDIAQIDHYCESYKNNINAKAPIIHVCSFALRDFMKIQNRFLFPFVLITNDTDYTVPEDIFRSPDEFENFLNNPYLIRWYSQNTSVQNEKLVPLPIGLDYHTYRGSIFGQERILENILSETTPFWERTPQIYNNCTSDTYNRRYGMHRKTALDIIPSDLIHNQLNRISREDTWHNTTKYACVLSPPGNGYDCHRTWETLVLGSIPIVLSTPIDHVFSDLPVWIVKSWKEVTHENMMKVIQQFKKKYVSGEFNMEKLKMRYWTDRMKKDCTTLQNKGQC